MKKFVCILLAVCLMLGVFAGCAEKPAEVQEEKVTIRLGGLKGPTTMGMVKLLHDAENGATENTYTYQLAVTGDELSPLMLQGNLDIISVPANLGAILSAKSNGGVQMVAVGTLGVLYIVEKGGEEISSVQSLKGKTIYATGKGTTPEYTLRHILMENGLDPDGDVTLEFKSEPAEIVAQMALEEHAVAMLPQPFVTVAKGKLEGLNIALDLTEEWNKVSGDSQLITAAVLVRKEFAQQYPQQLAKFLEEYAASVEYVNANPTEAAQMIEQYGIVNATVAEKAIPFCNLVCLTGEEMQASANGYFEVLYAQNPNSVGGAVPGAEFYYETQN